MIMRVKIQYNAYADDDTVNIKQRSPFSRTLEVFVATEHYGEAVDTAMASMYTSHSGAYRVTVERVNVLTPTRV